jgi:outer membrane protein assembly factor BamE
MLRRGGGHGQQRMRIILFLAVAILVGCRQNSELPAVISPYRIDIQQGNVVTQEMLAKLKAGMTRAQVRFALGSPLVVDTFHSDRWDYIYSYQRQGKDVERRRITVIFDEDKLIRIDGDVLPVDSTLISDRPVPRPPAVAEKPPAPKPEPVKPQQVEQPVVKSPPAAAPVVAKPIEPPVAKATETPAPSVAPVVKRAPEPVVPVATEVPKAEAKSAPVEQPQKTEVAKTESVKEKPKSSGIFGRMLDKIGF